MKIGTIQVIKEGSLAQISVGDLPAWELNGWTPVAKAQEAPQAGAQDADKPTDAGTPAEPPKRGRGRPKAI